MPPRLDSSGDPLPPDALARFGTTRLLHPAGLRIILPVGPRTVAAGGEGGIRLFDAETGRLERALTHPSLGDIGWMAADVLGRSLAWTSDARAGVVDVVRARPRWSVHVAQATRVTISEDGAVVAVTAADAVHLFDGAAGRAGRVVRGVDPSAESAELCREGRVLAVLKETGAARLFDTATGRLIERTKPPKVSGPSRSTMAPNASVVAVLQREEIVLARTVDGAIVRRLRFDSPGSVPYGAFTPDGRRLLTARQAPPELHVWDVDSGALRARVSAPLADGLGGSLEFGLLVAARGNSMLDVVELPDARTLDGAAHAGVPCAVAVAAEGRLTAAGGSDGVVRVVAHGRGAHGAAPDERRFAGHCGPVLAVAVSPRGDVVVSGGEDGTVRAWRLTSEGPGTTLLAGGPPVTALAISARGRVAAGDAEGRIRLWPDAAETEAVVAAGATGQPVEALAFSPTGDALTSADGAAGVRRLVVEVRLEPAVLAGAAAGARSVAERAEGAPIAGTSSGAILRLGAEEAEPLDTTADGGDVRLAARLTSGEDVVSISGWGGRLRVAVPGTPTPVLELFLDECPVTAAAVAPGGGAVAWGGVGAVRVWRPRPLYRRPRDAGHDGGVACLRLSADGARAWSGGEDASIRSWDAETGRQRYAVPTGRAPAALALSPGGRRLAWSTRHHDGPAAHLLDASTGREEPPIALADAGHAVLEWLSDSRLLVGTERGHVHLWDVAADREVWRWTRGAGITALAVDAARARIAVGSGEGAVWLLDASSGGTLHALRAADEQEIIALHFLGGARDELLVVEPRSIGAWRATGESRLLVRDADPPIVSGAASANGAVVACGSASGAIEARRTDGTGEPARLLGHCNAVSALSLSADGRRLASASVDGTCLVWDVGGLF